MKLQLISIFIICALFSNAQQYEHDQLLYTGVKLSKDLLKGFDVSAQYQLRLDNNITHLKGSYIYASVQYNLIKKYLGVEFEYRYSTSSTKDQHRFGIGLNGKYRHHKITYSDRLIYQREYEYFSSGYENGHEPSNYLRNRLQVKWDFKKHLDTYVSCEPFYKISNEENEIDQIRSILGLNWEFRKNNTINVFYQYQVEVNQSNPKMEHIIGLNYEWDLPKKFKKKKGDKS